MVRDITRHIGCRLDFRTSKTCYSKLIRNYEMELTVEMGLTLLSRGVQLLHVSIRRKFVNLPPLYSSTSSRVSITGLHMEAALRAAPRLCRLGRKPLIVLAIFLIALIPFFLLQLQPSERTALAETPEVLAVAHNNGPGLLKWIDPLVGTDGDGHVWLGSTVPNGMVKVGIDCDHKEPGYHPREPIIGISHTHVSGTGGGRSYQNMVLTPHWTTAPKSHLVNGTARIPSFVSERSGETIRAGFYSVHLPSVRINASMTSLRAFAKHRWSFSVSDVRALLQAENGKDLTLHALMKAKHPSMSFKEGEAKADGQKLMVSGVYKDGWASYFGQKQNYAEYPVFSCTAGAQLASRYGVLSNYENLHSTASDSTLAIKTSRTVGIYDYSGSGDNVGGYLSFDIDLDGTDQVDVILNVGLSFKSMDQACNHLKEAQEKSFEEVEGENARLWSLAMDAIEVRNPIMRGSETTILYSSLYRIFFMPANRTGEHPTWPDGTESLTYFDDYYTIWDTFRTTNPLLTLIDPELQSALIQSLINTAKYARGYFGDSQVGNHFGVTQGGNNGEILIAEAFLKKLPGINYTEAYEYVNRSVYTQTPLHYVFEGRGDVKDYLTNGYVGKKDAAEFAEDKDTMFSGNGDGFKSISVSRTLEYAYADFSISFLAKGLGYNRDAAAARKRSGNWKNLWDNETLDHGFQGFLQPRARAREAGKLGEWKRMSVTFGSPMENFHQYKEFYEDSSWSYSFFAPQNVASLIEYMGGVGTFLRRLDAFFELGHYNPGNEPSFLVPTLYHYAGRPDLSVRRVDFIVNHNYTAQPDGIPGNDDAGAMASWYICASIGLFPVAGQDIYLLLAPRFESITMKVGSKKEDGSRNQFLIRIQNVDDGDVNGEARIIQRATLNGNDLSRAWLRHEEIVRGGELVLLMGAKDSLWGTKEVDLPPSYNETE